MTSRYMLLITWVLLLITGYFCWQSYHQLHRAQTHIQSLEARIDTLRDSAAQYRTLQAAYVEIHEALSTSHDQLSDIGADLHTRSVDQLHALTAIKQHLDSLLVAYDTLQTFRYTDTTAHHLSFRP